MKLFGYSTYLTVIAKLIALLSILAVAVLATGFFLSDVSNLRQIVESKFHTTTEGPFGRGFVELEALPESLIFFVLHNEDKQFFAHSGFDFEQIKQSLVEVLTKKKKLRGASTITQQLSKNLFLTPERTLLRKIREAIYTSKLELSYSKREILSYYLNVVQWGSNIYGISAAADYYFAKDPSSLTLQESAFLASILPNPIALSGGFAENRHPLRLRTRMAEALRSYLSAKESLAKRSSPLPRAATLMLEIKTLKLAQASRQ